MAVTDVTSLVACFFFLFVCLFVFFSGICDYFFHLKLFFNTHIIFFNNAIRKDGCQCARDTGGKKIVFCLA